MSFLFGPTEFQLNQIAFKTNILLKILSQGSSLQAGPVPVHQIRSDLNGAPGSEGACVCYSRHPEACLWSAWPGPCTGLEPPQTRGFHSPSVTESIMMLTVTLGRRRGRGFTAWAWGPPCVGLDCVPPTPRRCPVPGPLNL